MRTFAATDRWRDRWPGAVVACMVVSGVSNPSNAPMLEDRLSTVERELRSRYAGMNRADMRGLPTFAAYDQYYKTFGQNYHVLFQVESVALKGKPIPRRAALVEAAFAEELRSGLLTALHDVDAIGERIVTDAATGDEAVTLYNGSTVSLDAGDMFMRDERGVLTSVIRGPASYGLVTPATASVAVCVYAPSGVASEAVTEHLTTIAANMRLVSDHAHVEMLEVVEA